jgi:NADPH2:quinone reductase
MRAIVCQEYGAPESLRSTETDAPEPGAGEALIRVKATGIGFVDALTVAGLYQVKPPLPFIPGSEFAGVVESIGAKIKHLQVGQRVIAMGSHGGLAEFATVNGKNITPIPDKLSFEAAASFLVNYCTALHGLDHCGRLVPGELLLVLGASGGVGMAAIDVAKAMGATVIAAASTRQKRDACLKAGADEVVDYLQQDWRQALKEVTDGRDLNIVYDPVGGKYSEPALRSLAAEGRFLVVGFAAGNIPKIPINLPLLKRCSICGVNWGAHMGANPEEVPRVLGQLMSWIEDDKIAPAAGQLYPLEETGRAMMAMLNREAIGKIVIDMS